MRTSQSFLVIFTAAALVAAALSSCRMPSFAGPSDEELQAAEQQVAALPPGTPERAAAEKKLAELRAARAVRDKAVSAGAAALNFLVPGAGVLLSIGYAFAQRSRSKKQGAVMAATMRAIEDFKNVGGEASVETLVALLSEHHDVAGVRAAVREALAILQEKQPPVRSG